MYIYTHFYIYIQVYIQLATLSIYIYTHNMAGVPNRVGFELEDDVATTFRGGSLPASIRIWTFCFSRTRIWTKCPNIDQIS